MRAGAPAVSEAVSDSGRRARIIVVRLALIVAALGALGCASAQPYRTATLVFDGSGPKALSAGADDIGIAQVAAHLMREKLGLPFPGEARVHLYVNASTFSEWLVRESVGDMKAFSDRSHLLPSSCQLSQQGFEGVMRGARDAMRLRRRRSRNPRARRDLDAEGDFAPAARVAFVLEITIP